GRRSWVLRLAVERLTNRGSFRVVAADAGVLADVISALCGRGRRRPQQQEPPEVEERRHRRVSARISSSLDVMTEIAVLTYHAAIRRLVLVVVTAEATRRVGVSEVVDMRAP